MYRNPTPLRKLYTPPIPTLHPSLPPFNPLPGEGAGAGDGVPGKNGPVDANQDTGVVLLKIAGNLDSRGVCVPTTGNSDLRATLVELRTVERTSAVEGDDLGTDEVVTVSHSLATIILLCIEGEETYPEGMLEGMRDWYKPLLATSLSTAQVWVDPEMVRPSS